MNSSSSLLELIHRRKAEHCNCVITKLFLPMDRTRTELGPNLDRSRIWLTVWISLSHFIVGHFICYSSFCDNNENRWIQSSRLTSSSTACHKQSPTVTKKTISASANKLQRPKAMDNKIEICTFFFELKFVVKIHRDRFHCQHAFRIEFNGIFHTCLLNQIKCEWKMRNEN